MSHLRCGLALVAEMVCLVDHHGVGQIAHARQFFLETAAAQVGFEFLDIVEHAAVNDANHPVENPPTSPLADRLAS
jgi:hypothetical protein